MIKKTIVGSIIAALTPACGPHVDGEEHPPGELVYEDAFERLYRLDRRVELIYDYQRDDGREGRCGFLTDRAYDDLERTLAALDPNVDYGEHPPDCGTWGVLIHVDGFEHSPFECSFECCHRNLDSLVFVYTMIFTNFDGGYPTVDGEPYVAIEPDHPCP